MRLWKSWIIAKKDMTILRRRRGLTVGFVALPLILSIALPGLLELLITRRGFSPARDTDLISAFGFFFLLIAVMLPLYLSSYSIVGEKVEKSIEPLLATPTSDGEILMGKYIGTFLPVLLVLYLAAVVYMLLIDTFTAGDLGYAYYPNWSFTIQELVAVPTAATYAITFSVFVSSKVNGAQTAYQVGAVTMIPFFALYVMGEAGFVNLNDTTNILYISAGLLVAAVVMYYVSRAAFGREKILTQWR